MTPLFDEHFAQLELAGLLEPVQFSARRTSPSGAPDETTVPIDLALPGDLTHAEQALGSLSRTAPVTRSWTIRKTDLDAAGIVPREGDSIRQADATDWTIDRITVPRLGATYRFLCSKGRK